MKRLSRSLSWLVCLALIFSAPPIPAQIQHGVPWQAASTPSGFAPAGAHLSYFGGPVVSNAHIVQVLYGTGSYNPQVAGTSSPTMGNFFFDFLGTNSGYINLLSQYNTNFSGGTNQIIGNGTFGGIFQITPSAANDGSTIDDSNIQAELLAQISAGHLPAPVLDAAGNVNTIYMIYFPPGKTITERGSTSCVAGGFCSYHGTTSSTLNSKHLLYGVMPDMQAGSGCSAICGASTVFGNYTVVTSHELSETITDADVGLHLFLPAGAPMAWYDPNNNKEIGDLCIGHQGSYAANGTTYMIQLEFSNAANNCLLPPPATNHTTLAAESSFQSPALAVFNSRLYIAWTGTDPNHTLNIFSTADGVGFSNHVDVGTNNSIAGPALAAFNGKLYMAWTGTDSNHHLNIASSSDGVHWSNPVTLGTNNSNQGPALTAFKGELWISWTGTDSNHHLNVATSTNGVNFDGPFTLGSNNSNEGPALTTDGSLIYIAWTGTDPNHTLNVAFSNGSGFSSPLTGQSSFQGPSLTSTLTNGILIGWVGTDPDHTINIGFEQEGGFGPPFTFGQFSPLRPALATFNNEVWVAWVGTDPNHTLNLESLNLELTR